jgi:hypothetical protein
MAITVRGSRGPRQRHQVGGGDDFSILWQDLGRISSDRRFGVQHVDDLRKLLPEHPGVQVIIRTIRDLDAEVVVQDFITARSRSA